MSVTGSGTQTDPYIFHDFDELKAIVDARTSEDGTDRYYVRLANDLNGNLFSIDYELPNIVLNQKYTRNIDIDLDGHVIKNFVLKTLTNTDGRLFHVNTSYYSIDTIPYIHDGVFKNILLVKRSSTYSTAAYTFAIGCYFDNVKFSLKYVNPTGSGGASVSTYGVFALCKLYRCSGDIWLETNKGINYRFFTHLANRSGGKVYTMEECDWRISLAAGGRPNVAYQCEDGTIKNSRITGKMATLAGNEYQPCQWLGYRSSGIANYNNCVVDIDVSGIHFNSTQTACSPVHGDCPNTMVNTDTFGQGMLTTLIVPCTSTELRNGDALRAKGFDVIND